MKIKCLKFFVNFFSICLPLGRLKATADDERHRKKEVKNQKLFSLRGFEGASDDVLTLNSSFHCLY